jgi:curved DNA-binding protein CbpA
VAADAPREVVDAAYRALAKLLHPDHHGAETTGRMQAVNDAYARLKKRSDPW